MRIALLGLGDIAQKAYLPLIAAMPGITPLLCTRQAAVLQQVMQQYRIKEGYTELTQLIAAKPDAVMIHSSTDSHFAVATQLLQAGIAVFIDKPLSYNLAECEQLLALAQQQNLPLFVGFNRRYAPLYQAALATPPIQLHYQKNRYNLPADSRTFIYDDFIHLLDFALYAGGVQNPAQLKPKVYGSYTGQQLASVQVHWQYQGAAFSVSMNRIAGNSFERLEYFGANQHWQIDNLVQGHYAADNQQQLLGFNDWHNTLYKRGFVNMLQAFVAQLQQGGTNPAMNQAALCSHQLCEQVVLQLQQDSTS